MGYGSLFCKIWLVYLTATRRRRHKAAETSATMVGHVNATSRCTSKVPRKIAEAVSTNTGKNFSTSTTGFVEKGGQLFTRKRGVEASQLGLLKWRGPKSSSCEERCDARVGGGGGSSINGNATASGTATVGIGESNVVGENDDNVAFDNCLKGPNCVSVLMSLTSTSSSPIKVIPGQTETVSLPSSPSAIPKPSVWEAYVLLAVLLLVDSLMLILWQITSSSPIV
ncbi:unnamed protein product [Protopolystoma xenopodis]|uniref:Uncharacterized protein n=1 Tax=Protopolystoma xenopodis TaxID=117903 RepID=A0A3S5BMW9_9PLAT|nr:unnamed protein product [Protopolystoma xenopodis]